MTRRAIVTGASSGIGRETALLLAREGIEVVLASRRLNALDELAKEIGWAGGAAHVRACDLTNRQSCLDLVDFARGLGPAYPILVNNAGYAEFRPFDQANLESIEREIATNLLGPLVLCHTILPWMLEQGGQIVNVLSLVVNRTLPGTAGYSVGKTGLWTLGKILAEEFRRQGLRVTNIIPGATDTPLWEVMDFQPERADMLRATAVAEAIRDVVRMPPDRNVDELQLMPPKGVL
ncbi:MAG TPA: SDR family NAD(P)-dependent oxidoreductase [Fimbriimonas sp.]